ncbi:MAG: hypothetical protein AVDCRST_MAG61-317, partial [uncultured Friedmanniella sp.]
GRLARRRPRGPGALARRRRRAQPVGPHLVLRPRADERVRHRHRQVLRQRPARGHPAAPLPRRHRLPARPGRHGAGDLPGRDRELLRRRRLPRRADG